MTETPIQTAPQWDEATLEKARGLFNEYARRSAEEPHPRVDTEDGREDLIWVVLLNTLNLPHTFHNVMSLGDAFKKGLNFEAWLSDVDFKVRLKELTTEGLHAFFANYCKKRNLHPGNWVGLRTELSELIGFGPSAVGIMMCEHFLQKGLDINELFRRITQFLNPKHAAFRNELEKIADQDVHFFFYKIVFVGLSEKYIELVKSFYTIRGCLFQTEEKVTDQNYSEIRNAAVVICSPSVRASIKDGFTADELEMKELGLEDLAMLYPLPFLLTGEDPTHIPRMEELMTKRFKKEVTE